MTTTKRCCGTCRFLMRFQGGSLPPRCVAPLPMWIKARAPWSDTICGPYGEPEDFGDGCLAWLASRARPAKKKNRCGDRQEESRMSAQGVSAPTRSREAIICLKKKSW